MQHRALNISENSLDEEVIKFLAICHPVLSCYCYKPGIAICLLCLATEVTARAVKSVSPELKVVSPATAGNGWMPEFIAFCAQNKVPVDFVSTHTYGVDQGYLDESGNSRTVSSKNERSIYGDIIRSKEQIAQSSLPDLPLHYTTTVLPLSILSRL